MRCENFEKLLICFLKTTFCLWEKMGCCKKNIVFDLSYEEMFKHFEVMFFRNGIFKTLQF